MASSPWTGRAIAPSRRPMPGRRSGPGTTGTCTEQPPRALGVVRGPAGGSGSCKRPPTVTVRLLSVVLLVMAFAAACDRPNPERPLQGAPVLGGGQPAGTVVANGAPPTLSPYSPPTPSPDA